MAIILLINGYAETHDVTLIILKHLREMGSMQKMVYFKRFYPNGRVRSAPLTVNAFVDRHIRTFRSWFVNPYSKFTNPQHPTVFI